MYLKLFNSSSEVFFFLHFHITPVLRYVKYANTDIKLALSKRDKV